MTSAATTLPLAKRLKVDAPKDEGLSAKENVHPETFKAALKIILERSTPGTYPNKFPLIAKDLKEPYGYLLPKPLRNLLRIQLEHKGIDPSLYGVNEPKTQINLSPSSGHNTNNERINGLQETMAYFKTVWLTRYPREPYPPTAQALFIKAMGKLIDVVRQSQQPLSSGLKADVIDWLQDSKYCLDPNTSLLWTLKKDDLELLKKLFTNPNKPDSNTEEQSTNIEKQNQLPKNKENEILTSIEFAIKKTKELDNLPQDHNFDAIYLWYTQLPENLKIDLSCIYQIIPINLYKHNFISYLLLQNTHQSLADLNYYKDIILWIANQFDLTEENHSKAYEHFLKHLSIHIPYAIQFLIEQKLQGQESYNEIKKLAELTLKHNAKLLFYFNNHFDPQDDGQFNDYVQLATIATKQSPYSGFEHAKSKLYFNNQKLLKAYLDLAEIAYHAHRHATEYILKTLDLDKDKGFNNFTKMAFKIANTYPKHHEWLANKIDFGKEKHIDLYLTMAKAAISKFPHEFSTFTSLNLKILNTVRPRIYKTLAEYALTQKTPDWVQIFNPYHLDLTQEENVEILKTLSQKAAKHPSFNFLWSNTIDIYHPPAKAIFQEIFEAIKETALQHNGLLLHEIGYKFDLNFSDHLASYTHLAKIAVKQNPAALGAVFLKFYEYANTPIAETLKKEYQKIEELLPKTKASSIPKNEAWAFRYINSFQEEKLPQAEAAVELLKRIANLPYQNTWNYVDVFNTCRLRYGTHDNYLELVMRLGAYLASTYGFDAVLAEGLKFSLDLNKPTELEAFRQIAEWGKIPRESKALKMA